MDQASDLWEFAPSGEVLREAWGREGLWARHGRRSCADLDPAGTTMSRPGQPKGSGPGAVAGAATAWILRELRRHGRRMPGAVGMAQSSELRGLGPSGNDQDVVGDSRGLWARGSRWNCRSLEGRRTRTLRTRIGEDDDWGYGLTVTRSERSRMRRVCETMERPDQVRRVPKARP